MNPDITNLVILLLHNQLLQNRESGNILLDSFQDDCLVRKAKVLEKVLFNGLIRCIKQY